MFGGHGLFAPNGGMFAAIVTDDRIALKFADDAARTALEAEGGRAWVWNGGPKPMTMREWILVPDAMYDDPTTLAAWARRAHALAKPSHKKTQRR